MLLTESLLGSASGPAANYIEDVFSTYLYTGNSTSGGTQTITNGVDLSTKGGMVWIKGRSAASNNVLFDTARGAGTTASNNQALSSNLNTKEDLGASYDFLSAFNTDGFTVKQGGTTTATRGTNYNNVTYASWTFRKQAKFFDIVTYTGNGVDGRTVAHNLGSVPGCIIIKSISNDFDPIVYHRSLGATKELFLNTTGAAVTSDAPFSNTEPTSSVFTLGLATQANENTATYVAYLFAHDAGGFGASGSDNVISCGSYTGTGAAGNAVTLGYEPQWLLIKRSSTAGNDWWLVDNMRGLTMGIDADLRANLSQAEENAANYVNPTATGFTVETTNAALNASGSTYIYIAIRRGPMKTPTSGTSVFSPNTYTGDGATNRLISSSFPADFAYIRDRNDGTIDYRQNYVQDRLRGGGRSLVTNSTGMEGSDTGWINSDMEKEFQSNSGILVTPYFSRFNASGKSYVSYQFRRAPGFFDVVCYTGDGVAGRTVTHNLTVAPELMIVKQRSDTANWIVYNSSLGATKYMVLNATNAAATSSVMWNDTSPNATTFTLGYQNPSPVNGGDTYVAYLFATVAGVSKVGSYTGSGTTKQIDCGFTGGARFVLIKRTDSTGDWYVWDSARGIVAGNDPYLLLNSDAAEVTNTDYIDTYSAGFEISSTAPAAINASGGTFIFLAIA